MPLHQPPWVKRFKEQQPVRDQITITGRQQPMVNATLPANGNRDMGSPIDSTFSTGAGEDGVVQPDRSTGRDMLEFHEGEEVVGNETVNNLGGNEAVRDIIDTELIRKGMDKSSPGGPVVLESGQGNVYGFKHAGTVHVDEPDTTKDPATPDPIIDPVADAGPTLGEPPTPPVKEAPTPFDQTGVGQIQKEMLQETRDIATGKSKLMTSLANQGFQNLDARQQTRLTQTAMQIASDPNLTEGQQRSMMSQTMRQHGIEQSELAGDLAIASMKEARLAIAESFKQTRGIQDYKERRRQWQENFDYKNATNAINAAIDAGDFEGAATMWDNELGIKIDYSEVIDARDQKAINNSLVNISANVAAGMDIDNDVMVRDLTNTWEKMHPGKPFNPESGTDSGDWARTTIDQMKRQSDPIAGDIYALADDSLSSVIRPSDAAEDWTMDEFEYKGLTGRKAAEAVMIDVKMEKGFTFDSDGKMTVDWDNPIWAATGVTKPAEVDPDEPVKEGYEKFGFTKSEFDNAEIFGEPIFKNNVPYVRTGDNPEDIVTLEEYQKKPNFENDPAFKDETSGEMLPKGSRITLGDQDWKRSKRTGAWQEVEALDFTANDEPWGSVANEIIELGEDVNPDLFKGVIESRVNEMDLDRDYSRLEGLNPGDALYDGAIESSTPFSTKGSYLTSGVENGYYFDDRPPSVGETVNINGKLYIVSEGVKYNEKTVKNEHEFFKVKDPTSKTGAVFTVYPPGVKKTSKFGYTSTNSISQSAPLQKPIKKGGRR